MKLIEGVENIGEPIKNAVVAIGNFDGVHKGHRALFETATKKAKETDGTSVVMTFEPHPLKVLNVKNPPPQITRYEQKVSLISKAGIDVLICIPFNKTFASLSPEAFVKELLLKKIGMKVLIVGKDYAFGKNRQGNLELLQAYGEKYHFEVIVKDWINSSDETSKRVSSTRIRNLVQDGCVKEVKDLLGRYYQIKGRVSQGRDRGGKLLGFPTANINIYDELCPKTGVYAVTVEFEHRVFQGVANIGFSPTFDDHKFTIEIHILDFKEDIYEKNIKVNFIERLRTEKKFNSIDELSLQIKKDIAVAREILAEQEI
ncbi:MAG: bifunctional riboflavin kinase/FAD synthetase [Proteobacteria bacterium]|nr:bifunctional riboflavin kinase/FAD synthetase [Pseudomonadota bacterium]